MSSWSAGSARRDCRLRCGSRAAPRPLPPALDLSAFRIVQEALTNTLKHAGPAQAQVTVRYEDGRSSLEIADTGRGPLAAAAAPAMGWSGCASGRRCSAAN